MGGVFKGRGVDTPKHTVSKSIDWFIYEGNMALNGLNLILKKSFSSWRGLDLLDSLTISGGM